MREGVSFFVSVKQFEKRIKKAKTLCRKAGLDSSKIYQGHTSVVTRLDFHPTQHDLLLSSSFDWSVKLWKVKVGRLVEFFLSYFTNLI